jgi:hypothetical protein
MATKKKKTPPAAFRFKKGGNKKPAGKLGAKGGRKTSRKKK